MAAPELGKLLTNEGGGGKVDPGAQQPVKRLGDLDVDRT
jgi:hypothetical protein